MSKLKKELQRQIANHIFNNTNLDYKIEILLEDGIDDSIDYSSEDADHKKPSGIPADSIIQMKQPEFQPIDDFTKLRRRVYRKLGKSAQDTRDAMKEEAIKATRVEKSLDGTTLKFRISNRSPLLVYLRSGKLGESARKDSSAVRSEAGFVWMTAKELGLEGDADIRKYIYELEDLADGGGNLGKIPIRDVLRASVELIGKDFIRSNII